MDAPTAVSILLWLLDDDDDEGTLLLFEGVIGRQLFVSLFLFFPPAFLLPRLLLVFFFGTIDKHNVLFPFKNMGWKYDPTVLRLDPVPVSVVEDNLDTPATDAVVVLVVVTR